MSIHPAPTETAMAFDGAHWGLPGEKGKWGVYAVSFDDGCVYVEKISRMVLDRLEEHYGEGERGNGIGTLAIIQHRQAGIAYRFEVLASGLQEQEARDREAVEIHALTHPLNVMFASRAPTIAPISAYYPNRELSPATTRNARNDSRLLLGPLSTSCRQDRRSILDQTHLKQPSMDGLPLVASTAESQRG